MYQHNLMLRAAVSDANARETDYTCAPLHLKEQ
jgi:hypothetical protein